MVTFHEFEYGFWDTTSLEYDEGFGSVTSQAIASVINNLALLPGDRLLDVACGPGYVSSYLHAAGIEVTGLDFSSAMIELAKQRNPDGDFQVGDAQDLPFEDNTFHGICTNFGMLHFANSEAVLDEMQRVLKSGGRMVYTVWSEREGGSGLGLIMDAIKNVGATVESLPEAPPFFRFANREEASAALLNAEFTDVKFEQLEVIWRIKSAKFYVDKFGKGGARVGEILRGQNEEIYQEIIAHVEKSLKMYPQDKTGTTLVPTPILLASARK